MEVTDVRVKLEPDHDPAGPGNGRLLAFATIVLDGTLAIHDLKIIDGCKGAFIAFPSRRLADRCHHCGTKNHLKSRFCNHCGSRMDEFRAIRYVDGLAQLHADVAHPIVSSCRDMIQDSVMEAYYDEVELSRRPGYVPRYEMREVVR